MTRPFPDEAFDDYVDRVTADERQRELDDAAEDEAKRTASGMSPEILSLQEAFLEGQRAGARGDTAGLNPHTDVNSPEFAEWERGRAAIANARLSNAFRRVA